MERFRPKLYCRSVQDIDFKKLADQGITNICFDLDNTIALRDAMEPATGVREYISKARKQGYIRKLALVSNVIWGEQRCQRVLYLASLLDIEHVFTAWFWDGKPSSVPFVTAMKMMSSTPETTAIVGDQIFTDIYGGNRLGLYTILVSPLGPDHWSTGLMQRRYLEAQLIKSFQLELQCKEGQDGTTAPELSTPETVAASSKDLSSEISRQLDQELDKELAPVISHEALSGSPVTPGTTNYEKIMANKELIQSQLQAIKDDLMQRLKKLL